MPSFEFLSQKIKFLQCLKVKNSQKYWVSPFKVSVWHGKSGFSWVKLILSKQ